MQGKPSFLPKGERMKRYIMGVLVAAIFGAQSIFGFGGGFQGFPSFGGSFPNFNPGGISSESEQEEKNTEFAVLAGYSGIDHSEVGGIAFAPSIQLRLTAKRFQFTIDGTYAEQGTTAGDKSGVVLVYGGLGYQLVKAKAFNLSASVVAGYGAIWDSERKSYSYSGYYSGYYDYGNDYVRRSKEGFLVGADLLAMLRLGNHFGIYANGLLSTGGLGAKLGIAYNF